MNIDLKIKTPITIGMISPPQMGRKADLSIVNVNISDSPFKKTRKREANNCESDISSLVTNDSEEESKLVLEDNMIGKIPPP